MLKTFRPLCKMDRQLFKEIYIMKIRASHILVKTKEEAENLLLDIKNGVAFEDLAKEYFYKYFK